MRSDKEDKPEGISGDLLVDVVRIILEKMSDMCVRKFGVFEQRLLNGETAKRNETKRQD